MERHQRVTSGKVFGDLAGSQWQELNKRVNHGVADQPDLVARYAFAKQVSVAVLRRREQEVGNLVG